jgi:hypothetical protein
VAVRDIHPKIAVDKNVHHLSNGSVLVQHGTFGNHLDSHEAGEFQQSLLFHVGEHREPLMVARHKLSHKFIDGWLAAPSRPCLAQADCLANPSQPASLRPRHNLLHALSRKTSKRLKDRKLPRIRRSTV